MAMSKKHKMDIINLFKEIANLKTLLYEVDKGSDALDALTNQKQKVLDILPVTPFRTDAIHRLLSCGPFTKTEIPLDVLEKLIESGFDVNVRFCKYFFDDDFHGRDDSIEYTCLNLAIKNEHYSAVRCLVQLGADCEIGSIVHNKLEEESNYGGMTNFEEDYTKTPLAELVLKTNAPLDLFDLLATPQSLMNNGDNHYLPLNLALGKGDSESALRLIKLGADINLKDNNGHHPLKLYEENIKEYHDELFFNLIPSEAMAALQYLGRLMNTDEERSTETQSKMIHRLFQNMKAADHLHVDVELDLFQCRIGNMVVNQKAFPDIWPFSMKILYWGSLICVNLGWKILSTPQAVIPFLRDSASEDNVQFAHKIDDIWNTYRVTGTVMTLQNMCIQQTRRCMRDFSDESFMSLPVPNKLRKLLMYQHVADIACEAVTCMSTHTCDDVDDDYDADRELDILLAGLQEIYSPQPAT